MRIYTEVNFIWDDKQDKLTETSSKSFDYQGELALCYSYKQYDRYDSQGNHYSVNIKGKRQTFGKFRTYYTWIEDKDGNTIWSESEDDWGSSTRLGEAEDWIKTQSHDNKLWNAKDDAWGTNYKGTYGGLSASGDATVDAEWANKYDALDDDGKAAAAENALKYGTTVTVDSWTPFTTAADTGDVTLTSYPVEGDANYNAEYDYNNDGIIDDADMEAAIKLDTELAEKAKTSKFPIAGGGKTKAEIVADLINAGGTGGEQDSINRNQFGSEAWYQWELTNNLIDAGGTFDPEAWWNPLGTGWERRPEKVPLSDIARGVALQVETAMADWKAITDPGTPDIYQDVLENALVDLERSEVDLMKEFEAAAGTDGEFGRIKAEWERDIERLTGEEGTYTVEKADIEEGYTTAVSRLTGEAVYDEEGNIIEEGTYTAGVRVAGEEREEGLEATVVTREEGLEALREEAVGGIRTAEAKIGAAGFAATGVGRTARDVMAEEIGKEARDIDVALTEEREGVEKGYTEDISATEKLKKTGLTDYLETKTKALARIETGKATALENYLSARDAAKRTADQPWEATSLAYERLLEDYGGVKGEKGDYILADVTGGTAREAEAGLAGIQAELEAMITGVRMQEGYEDWDPFTVGIGEMEERTALYEREKEFGWDPITGTFSTEVTKGLFDPTLKELAYDPSEAVRLYDPEYDWLGEQE